MKIFAIDPAKTRSGWVFAQIDSGDVVYAQLLAQGSVRWTNKQGFRGFWQKTIEVISSYPADLFLIESPRRGYWRGICAQSHIAFGQIMGLWIAAVYSVQPNVPLELPTPNEWKPKKSGWNLGYGRDKQTALIAFERFYDRKADNTDVAIAGCMAYYIGVKRLSQRKLENFEKL